MESNLIKGGAGSGSWSGPGQPRFARSVRQSLEGLPPKKLKQMLEKLKAERYARLKRKPGEKPAKVEEKPNKVSEKPKETQKPKVEELKEGVDKVHPVKSEDRKDFISFVTDVPGKEYFDKNNKKASPYLVQAVEKFSKDGNVEDFISSMRRVEAPTTFIAALRTETMYAAKYGGLDVVKSKALIKVRDKSVEVVKKISEDEAQKIQDYTTDVSVEVNAVLRGKDKGPMPEGGDDIVKAVTKAVDMVGEWHPPGTVYHGVNSQSIERTNAFIAKAKEAMKTGTIWEEKGILSTSASRDMSEEWISQGASKKGNGVVMRIKAKTGLLISQFTGLPNQQEIIQKPGTKYKVIGITSEKWSSSAIKDPPKVTIIDYEEV